MGIFMFFLIAIPTSLFFPSDRPAASLTVYYRKSKIEDEEKKEMLSTMHWLKFTQYSA